MITDTIRMDAYTEALRRAITPGCTVLDIGTGTGIFAMLACQYGAGHVYAIETNDAIITAMDIAKANGFADHITFIQALSTDTSLPEQVDVIISDLRGTLPLHSGNITAIIDARQRFLKPDGKMIPLLDRLYVAPVFAPKDYETFVGAWQYETYNLDMDAARQITLNSWGGIRTQGVDFVAEPQTWTTIDYANVDTPNAHGLVMWDIETASESHGLCFWFDTILKDDIGFSTFNSDKRLVYGNGFLPFLKPIHLEQGDTLRVKLDASLINGDYIWSWQTQVLRPTQATKPIINYKQSTFQGVPFSINKLRKRAASFVPRVNQDGHITHFILDLMVQEYTLEHIAKQVLDKFPDRFSSYEDALPHVSKLSERYSD
jgi:type I protein arginine methyltransferase